MPVVPSEANSVLPNRFRLCRPSCGLEHRQSARDRFHRVPRLAAIRLPLLVAKGTRARIAKERKGIGAAVPVLPLNIDARTGGGINLYGFRINLRVYHEALIA